MRAERKKEDVADVWESHFLFLCRAIWGPSEAVASRPFSRSVIWGKPDSSRQNRKGRQQLLENAQRPDLNLRASQSVLPVEHSVTPCQLSDHTTPVQCCTSAGHHKSFGRCDSYPCIQSPGLLIGSRLEGSEKVKWQEMGSTCDPDHGHVSHTEGSVS
ncbi:Tryptophan synthase beta chain [Clarias magur]|uniref:Tryptophan synthase beta chain n=1 Tax=Clarias magur TaxID=1594786 RepID=A0A8J4TLY3_CLAMG|nr:Tryptophan synthase beta chain [Clarias magur]